MNELKALYSVTNKVIQNSQLGNYFPPKIYTDVAQLKYMREKVQSKYVRDKSRAKLDLTCKKGTFLQQIQRRQTHLPSPQTYKPQYVPQYKSRKISDIAYRSTFINQVVKQNQRNPTPSPNLYQPLKHKSVSLGSFPKSANTNYLDGVVYTSTTVPGVGQYNPKKYSKQNYLGKFNKAKRLSINKQNVLPDAATYNPKIPSISLFSQIPIQKLKGQKPKFNKEKRFQNLEKKNPNKNLFYTGISQWGMKTNYKKKDILSTLSTHNIYSKSVYYN